MKRILCLFIAAMMMFTLCACGAVPAAEEEAPAPEAAAETAEKAPAEEAPAEEVHAEEVPEYNMSPEEALMWEFDSYLYDSTYSAAAAFYGSAALVCYTERTGAGADREESYSQYDAAWFEKASGVGRLLTARVNDGSSRFRYASSGDRDYLQATIHYNSVNEFPCENDLPDFDRLLHHKGPSSNLYLLLPDYDFRTAAVASSEGFGAILNSLNGGSPVIYSSVDDYTEYEYGKEETDDEIIFELTRSLDDGVITLEKNRTVHVSKESGLIVAWEFHCTMTSPGWSSEETSRARLITDCGSPAEEGECIKNASLGAEPNIPRFYDELPDGAPSMLSVLCTDGTTYDMQAFSDAGKKLVLFYYDNDSVWADDLCLQQLQDLCNDFPGLAVIYRLFPSTITDAQQFEDLAVPEDMSVLIASNKPFINDDYQSGEHIDAMNTSAVILYDVESASVVCRIAEDGLSIPQLSAAINKYMV